jgi:hypothetical protein
MKKERTFADTALTLAMVALPIAYVASLFWVRGGSAWLRVHTLLADLAGFFGRIQDRSMTAESRLFLFAIFTTFVAQEFFRSVFAAAWRWSKR